MKIGCHVSIAGGIHNAFDRADELGCEVFQVFTQNQRQWKSIEYDSSQLSTFHKAKSASIFNKYPIIAHGSYLINLCAQTEDKLNKSRFAFIDELKRCDALGINFLVIHPGAHGGKGKAWGMEAIAESINFALREYMPSVKILIETTAGQGTGVGHCFEDLADIIHKIESPDKMGVCVDSCHIFAAGYDIRTEEDCQATLDKMQLIIGLDKVKVWHLNDSKRELDSRVDRHAPLGEGQIGMNAFNWLINHACFTDTPGILEVPGGDEVFKLDISVLKSLRI